MTQRPPMRSLFVAEVFPWPPRDGYRLRLANLATALTELGAVDVVCLDAAPYDATLAPSGIRIISVPEGPQRPRSDWLRRWVRSEHPRRVVWRDFDGLAERIAGASDGQYDVAVFGHLETFVAAGEVFDVPSIVDFDNLENLSMRSQRQAGPELYSGMGATNRAQSVIGWIGRTAMNLVDERRWNATQLEIADRANRVLVCSTLDVERSGCPNAVSIPNGYEQQWPARTDRPAGPLEAPRFLFIGGLSYPPNADAARWFARDVLPVILRSVPNASFRIVGKGAEAIADLEGLAGVTVVGQVETLRPEIDGADICVVPIRIGAGTRLKVVEALANRLPLVSTTVGSEGIDVSDGEHVLFADEVETFAAACVTLANDGEARRRLSDQGFERYQDRYQWSTIRRSLADLVEEIVPNEPTP